MQMVSAFQLPSVKQEIPFPIVMHLTNPHEGIQLSTKCSQIAEIITCRKNVCSLLPNQYLILTLNKAIFL